MALTLKLKALFLHVIIFLFIVLEGKSEISHVINTEEKHEIGSVSASSPLDSEKIQFAFKRLKDATDSERDSLILANFFNNSFGVFWTVKWDLTQPMDTWIGVTLNDERRVIGIELVNNHVSGSIPSNFGNLSALEKLIIADDENFDGRIPEEIGNLSELQVFRISNTEVNWTIPSSLGQLPNLQKLDLSDNLMFGTIPENLGNLSKLTELRLDNNGFSGDLPESLGNLTNLQVIELSQSQFTYVPDMTASEPEIFNVQRNKLTFESLLPNLDILDTYVPQDSVGVPQSVNLFIAESFTLNFRIDEEISDNIYTWFKDGTEILQTNESTFTFENVTDADEGEYTFTVTNPGLPTLTLPGHPVILNVVNSCAERDSLAVLDVLYALGTPRAVFDFDIKEDPLEEWPWITLDENRCVVTLDIDLYNGLTRRTDGKAFISPAIGDLANLRKLVITDIGNDKNESIHGSLPPEIGKLVNLDTLQIWGSYMFGTIPDEFSDLTQLQYLWLQCNLSGNLPDFISRYSNLRYLQLVGNQFSGEIPLSYQNLTFLEWFDISRNQLSGNIPEIFGNMPNMRGLSLGFNSFEGTIPEQIWNLPALTNLYLSNNQLSGTISENFGNLTELQFLNLGFNQLEGSIPSSLRNLTKLRNLYLNDNLLSGTIPEGIGNLIDMSYCYLNNNQLSGSIPESMGNLDESLLWVHLENNQLSGAIPEAIENWTGVFELHLHNNQLSGAIPAGIGNMERLRLLSLHHNQLAGSIPRAIGNLENLSTIRLNDNELTGAVPGNLGQMKGLFSLFLQNNQLTHIESGFTIKDPENTFQVSRFRIENNLLTSLPNLAGMPFMKNDTTGVFGNQLTFEDILPNMGLIGNFSGSRFFYFPQDSIGEELEVALNQGENYTIQLGIDEDVENNFYQWFKDGTPLQSTSINELLLENLTAEDAGVYTAEVTNPEVPNLTLFSRTVTIIVNSPPIFTSTPVTEAVVGTEYTYNITTSDPESDAITITATNLPDWLELTDFGDGTATLLGTPQIGNCSDNQVVLMVQDAGGLFVEQSFEIIISLDLTVVIEAIPTVICIDESVTFTATLNHDLENAIFTWLVNDNVIEGENAPTFTADALNDEDIISVEVTTEETQCITNTVANASETINVADNIELTVSITSDKTKITEGESVTFTANTDFTEGSIGYQWFINEQEVSGETTAIFQSDLLQNDDRVKVRISVEPILCLINNQAESEEIIIEVTNTSEVFVQDFDKTMEEDTRLAFSSLDFSDAFSSSENLSSVQITTLPANGSLLLNESNVAINHEIPVSQLSDLVYVPALNFNGEDNFDWNGSSGTLYAQNDAMVIITINPVNDPPTFVISGDVTVSENFNTVEVVSVTQDDVPIDETNQVVTYQLIPPTVSFANITFDPLRGRVSITSVSDQTGQQQFEIVASDGEVDNGIYSQTFMLNVQPANAFPPENIAVDNLTIPENQPIGTLVGFISVSDQDPNDRHIFTLEGNGLDNGFFLIDGNQLKTNTMLDFEEQSIFRISIRATDLGGNFLEERFTVSVTDENDLPQSITLSAAEVRENEPIDILVGVFTAQDQDSEDELTFTLVEGIPDNELFNIVNNELYTNAVFDFEDKTEYNIRVQAEDGNGGVLEEILTIKVIDIEPETISIISGFTPDNDRMNDTWEIPGLIGYPDCTVEVFNSWGQRILYSKGYQVPWDGTHKNENVPVGTYYFIINLNNGQPTITGDISIMR